MPEILNTKKETELENHDNTQLRIGAASLTAANFDNRHQIVDSSFNKALKNKEKLPGKNNERRNYAYLSRLEKLVEKHGNPLEKKLWQASTYKLIIKPEDIPDEYWENQEQILRDNGQGRELSDYEKSILIDNIKEQQKESLESWANYLGDERSPYPLWFKVYAWDGMSKMGAFDKDTGHFTKRDKTTVAPYPKLNPAVLAKTYTAITDAYKTEDTGIDPTIKKLAKSGNFNKLYSKILLGEKAIPKTPERTEDIYGEWIEYLPGDEEKLASAAEGTPWCIANTSTGQNYLRYGEYGEDWDDLDDDKLDDEYYNKAKFILFHLYDPEKNTLSETACASIRLDPDGNVAEISGLNEGQALEDSLVPIVEKKVKSLPGGENFLKAFADKKELIRLDRKMQNNEDLTKEELGFIYEINHKIHTLDTYNTSDPRIKELKDKYPVKYALDAGVDADQLIQNLSPKEILHNLHILKRHNIKMDIYIDEILDSMKDIKDYEEIGPYIDTLTQIGIDERDIIAELRMDIIFQLIENNRLDPDTINDFLEEHVSYHTILNNLDILSKPGVKIDMRRLMYSLKPKDLTKENIEKFAKYGIDIDDIAHEFLSRRNYDQDTKATITRILSYELGWDQDASKWLHIWHF